MRKIDKPWGYEFLWAFLPDKYAAKIILVKEGRRLSLQYHREKDETLLLRKGRAILSIDGKNMEMEICEPYHIRPGKQHRISALKDSEIFEVSTTELSDVVRVEDDYDRA